MLRCIILILCAVLLTSAYAQQPNLEPGQPGNKPVPTITFEFASTGAAPAHYAIAVESDGRAAYRSDDIGTPKESGVPYLRKFTMSSATVTRIFALARRAKLFQGNFQTKHKVANTGAYTLTYSEGPAVLFGHPTTGTRNSTTYTYSDHPAIQQLTTVFENVANSLELGRRLDYLRRFDRLGLDAELTRAEELAGRHDLLELQAIAPSLRGVVDDTAVTSVARNRAQRLLALAAAPPK